MKNVISTISPFILLMIPVILFMGISVGLNSNVLVDNNDSSVGVCITTNAVTNFVKVNALQLLLR